MSLGLRFIFWMLELIAWGVVSLTALENPNVETPWLLWVFIIIYGYGLWLQINDIHDAFDRREQ